MISLFVGFSLGGGVSVCVGVGVLSCFTCFDVQSQLFLTGTQLSGRVSALGIRAGGTQSCTSPPHVGDSFEEVL